MKRKKKASSSSAASVAGASCTFAAVADSTVSGSSVTKRSTRRSTRLDKKDKVSDDEPKAGSSGHQSNSKSTRAAINGRSGANIDSGQQQQQQQTKPTKLDTDKKATSLLKMKKRSTSVPAVFPGKAEDLVRRPTRAAAKSNHPLIDDDEQMQTGSGGKSTTRSVGTNNKQPHQINAKSANALATVSGSGGNQANRASNDNNKRNGQGAAATGRGRSSADFDSSDDEQIKPTKLRKKAPLAKKRSKPLPAVVSSSDEEEEEPTESTRPRRSTRNAAKKSKVIIDVTEPKAGPSGCRRSNQRSVANNHKQPQSSPQANGDSDSEAKPQEEEEEEEMWGKAPSDSDSPEWFEYMRNSVPVHVPVREPDTESEAHTASEDEVEEVTHYGRRGILYKLRCPKGTLTVLRLEDYLKKFGRFYTVLPDGEHDEWYSDDKYYTNDGHPIEWEFRFMQHKPFTVKSLTAAGVRRWEKRLRKRQQYKDEQAAIEARNAQDRLQNGTTPEHRAARRQKRLERRRRRANGTMPTLEEEFLDGVDLLHSLWNTLHEETETDSTVDEEHEDVITLSSGPEDEVIQLSD